jgi:hypothetical protein
MTTAPEKKLQENKIAIGAGGPKYGPPSLFAMFNFEQRGSMNLVNACGDLAKKNRGAEPLNS